MVIEIFGPIIAIGMGMGIALTISAFIGQQIIKAFREDMGPSDAAITAFIDSVDQRKKKKDEYDAYYDERLADDSLPDAVAYYEDSTLESEA